MKSDIASMLKSKRRELNLSVKEVVNRLNMLDVHISEKTLYGWENGHRQPDADEFLALCAIYSINSFDDIEKASSFSEEAMEIAKAYDDLDSHGREMLRTVSEKELARKAKEDAAKEEANRQKNKAEHMSASRRSMRYYLIPPAAGYASPIEGEDYEMIEVGDDVPQNASFCLDIDGDSMEPYIHDGQRVYVQRDVDVKEFEDAGIWFYNGNVYCKQYCVDSSGTLILLSANPARQDANIHIKPEEQFSLICYGKVLLPFKLPRPQY